MEGHLGYVYLQTGEDVRWFDYGLQRGWSLPDPADAWVRLPVARHARWLYRAVSGLYWDWHFRRYGLEPSGYEYWLRYAIWKGWC